MRVTLHFSGCVTVEVADELNEDSEGWPDAIAEAWAKVPAEDISNSASLDESTSTDEGWTA